MNGSLSGNSIVGGSQASYVIFFPYISRSGALTADALSGSGICGVFELDLKASVKALNGLEVDIVYWQRQLTSTNKFLKSLEERRKQLESEISKGVNIAVTNQINSYTNESNFLQNQIQYITNNI
jgi:septal ring factor EnvC (AmiA/AmiB activator)